MINEIRAFGSWCRTVVLNILIYAGSAVPMETRQGQAADRVSAIRSGLQLLISGSLLMLGGLATLSHTMGNRLSWNSELAIAALYASAIMLIDHAFIERVVQIRGEQQVARFRWTFPAMRRGTGMLLVCMCLFRLPIAAVNGMFIGRILGAHMFATPIARLQVADANRANQPLVEQARREVEEELGERKAASDSAQGALAAILARQPAPSSTLGDSSYSTQIAAANANLVQLRQSLAASHKEENDARHRMSCEREDGFCDGSKLPPGKGREFRMAEDRAKIAVDEQADLKDQIARQQASLDALLKAQTDSTAVPAHIETENSRIWTENVAAARLTADRARDDYLTASAQREDHIRHRAEANITFISPEVGLDAELRALDRLDGDNWFGTVRQLTAMITLAELGAIIAAIWFRRRTVAEVRDFTNYITGCEEEVFLAERTRRQRPPLDGYGRGRSHY